MYISSQAMVLRGQSTHQWGDQAINLLDAWHLRWEEMEGALKNVVGTVRQRFLGKDRVCPDGENHPLAVCARAWRGDVCGSCPHCRL